MSAASLREAARVLRERAEESNAQNTSGRWWPASVLVRIFTDDHSRLGAPLSGPEATADAALISAMSPAVGLALADWLDASASLVGETEAEANCPCADVDNYHSALAVADAILGGAS